MDRLLLFAVVGFVAQLVDGALGMGYGATSATVLIAAGYTPASTGATVLLAQLGTTFVSGMSHWRFGNVEWRIVRTLAIPGGIAGFLGANLLSRVDADVSTPFIAGFLFLLGVSVLARFAFGVTREGKPHSALFLRVIGSIAGFFHSSGGGWGPIATPTLLANGSMAPRKVVGSVCTAEFIVVASASFGYLVSQGGDYEFVLAGGLLIGGMLAAPIAAYLVRLFHPRILGTLVGGIILLTNVRTGAEVLEVGGAPVAAVAAVIIAVLAFALVHATRTIRRERVVELARAEAEAEPGTSAPDEAVEPIAAVPGEHTPEP